MAWHLIAAWNGHHLGSVLNWRIADLVCEIDVGNIRIDLVSPNFYLNDNSCPRRVVFPENRFHPYDRSKILFAHSNMSARFL